MNGYGDRIKSNNDSVRFRWHSLPVATVNNESKTKVRRL